MARIVFMGTPEFAVPALRALIIAGYHVVGVVAQPDRPVGRGQVITAGPVKRVALEHDIPVFQPAKMKVPETQATLASFGADLAIVAAYGRILPKSLLDTPRLGCVNVHASLLPRHRGAAPIAHAIWAGDRETGVCIMRMEEGLDTGPVYGEDRLSISADDTTSTLTVKLAELGARTLVQLLPGIIAGTLSAIPQSSEGVTYAPPLKKDDGRLDLREPAEHLERHVRAMAPWPTATVTLGTVRVGISKTRVVRESGHPGEVLRADKQGVVVACGQDALALDEIQLPGKRPMTSAAWVAGRGVTPGARFELSDVS